MICAISHRFSFPSGDLNINVAMSRFLIYACCVALTLLSVLSIRCTFENEFTEHREEDGNDDHGH